MSISVRVTAVDEEGPGGERNQKQRMGTAKGKCEGATWCVCVETRVCRLKISLGKNKANPVREMWQRSPWGNEPGQCLVK